jgi:hypothetical protein
LAYKEVGRAVLRHPSAGPAMGMIPGIVQGSCGMARTERGNPPPLSRE